ncbi:hypothetical protein VTK73DRAFT_1739 [Phialemonium thermophilum]|uniref:Uncharacterized protein n=1 Tax=Phialemonium thermophilum TaxID=223376 RepID=A0ABR3VT52_9PEZI
MSKRVDVQVPQLEPVRQTKDGQGMDGLVGHVQVALLVQVGHDIVKDVDAGASELGHGLHESSQSCRQSLPHHRSTVHPGKEIAGVQAKLMSLLWVSQGRRWYVELDIADPVWSTPEVIIVAAPSRRRFRSKDIPAQVPVDEGVAPRGQKRSQRDFEGGATPRVASSVQVNKAVAVPIPQLGILKCSSISRGVPYRFTYRTDTATRAEALAVVQCLELSFDIDVPSSDCPTPYMLWLPHPTA